MPPRPSTRRISYPGTVRVSRAGPGAESWTCGRVLLPAASTGTGIAAVWYKELPGGRVFHSEGSAEGNVAASDAALFTSAPQTGQASSVIGMVSPAGRSHRCPRSQVNRVVMDAHSLLVVRRGACDYP